MFQYPQAGRKRTKVPAALSEGEYTHEILRGQVKMH